MYFRQSYRNVAIKYKIALITKNGSGKTEMNLQDLQST